MTKRRKERLRLRVMRAGDLAAKTGVLVPADGLAQGRLRARNYHTGSEVFAELRKPRNPGFHRLAHAVAALAVDNIESFTGVDAHSAIKRLQLESGAGCEEVALMVGGTMVTQRIPLSLSFESMDEGEFQQVMQAICQHIVTQYWPDTDVDEIIQMADQFERAA